MTAHGGTKRVLLGEFFRRLLVCVGSAALLSVGPSAIRKQLAGRVNSRPPKTESLRVVQARKPKAQQGALRCGGYSLSEREDGGVFGNGTFPSDEQIMHGAAAEIWVGSVAFPHRIVNIFPCGGVIGARVEATVLASRALDTERAALERRLIPKSKKPCLPPLPAKVFALAENTPLERLLVIPSESAQAGAILGGRLVQFFEGKDGQDPAYRFYADRSVHRLFSPDVAIGPP